MKNKLILRIFMLWLPQLFLITVSCFFVYTTSQQMLRLGANNPQIQLSEDTAAALASGTPPAQSLGANKVAIESSLAPYTVVFDDNGNPVASTGLLEGKIPVLPQGVLAYARIYRQDRITWQPLPGVRSAVVVTRFEGGNSGFVMVGRSLREVEKLEDWILTIAAAAWFVSACGSLVTSGLLLWLATKFYGLRR